MTQETQQTTDAGDGALGKAQEVAAQAKEQVQEKADEVKGRATDRMKSQLNERSTDAADQVSSFAQALHRAGQQLEQDGNQPAAKAVHSAGEQIERMAGYLSTSDADRFLADIEQFSRRRPWVAGGIGAAVGFVAARFVKASSESRYDGGYRLSDSDAPMRGEAEQSGELPPLLPRYTEVRQ